VECHYCHKIRYIQKYCFQLKKENKCKREHKEKDHDDDLVATTTYGDHVMLSDHESINLVSDKSMWIIDNGVILNVTPR